MIRYVGQLYTLYWHAWGLFFPILILVLSSVAALAVLTALRILDRHGRLRLGVPSRRGQKFKSEV